MKKLSFIFSILKRRVSNIVLLSIMFSALLLIFMVGFSLKDIFYDYLRSGYGNIADIQIKVDNLKQKDMQTLTSKIQTLDVQDLDILYGYEGIYPISVTDSEDSILAKDMPIFIKGIALKNSLDVLLDGKKESLRIVKFEYDDRLHIELNVSTLDVQDKDSIEFLVKQKPIQSDFCTITSLEDTLLTIESRYCKDEIDTLFERIEEKKSKFLHLNINETKDIKTKILDIDTAYRTLVLQYDGSDVTSIAITLEDITIDNNLVEMVEAYDGELIITFKRVENMELEYKRFMAQILKNYINYNRFVLDVKYYAFSDDDEVSSNTNDEELTYLNELSDFLDLVIKQESNLALSSSYLAHDLNNLGILDNFTIESNEVEFSASIRSTFYYNPEKLYDKNILIFNKKVLERYFGVGDESNFIDIYINGDVESYMEEIKQIVLEYDDGAKFIMQEEIIPSIGPKKHLFNTIVISFSLLIFAILFVAMYVVLRQFYSNFESELALLKLFGLNQPYQTYINLISFVFSSFIIYFILKYEESVINEIMMKYFFSRYDFDMNNYVLSLIILFVYIVVIYLLEVLSIKKLNIVKGQ